RAPSRRELRGQRQAYARATAGGAIELQAGVLPVAQLERAAQRRQAGAQAGGARRVEAAAVVADLDLDAAADPAHRDRDLERFAPVLVVLDRILDQQLQGEARDLRAVGRGVDLPADAQAIPEPREHHRQEVLGVRALLGEAPRRPGAAGQPGAQHVAEV